METTVAGLTPGAAGITVEVMLPVVLRIEITENGNSVRQLCWTKRAIRS